MRALVTGGAGFLGSYLCEALLAEGYSVVAVDNLLTGRETNLAHLARESRFELRRLDIIQPFDAGAVDYVFHFASPASPVDYMVHGVETLQVGSLGTFHALDVARRYGAKFFLASTSECYGDPLEHPQKETYWGNVNPVGPRSVYDEAKRFSEAATMAYHRYYKLDTRIVRIFNTYGPRMQLNDGRVIPNFMKQALRGEDLTVYGDGSQTRSFCYVTDEIEGILRLARSHGTPARQYRQPQRVHHGGVRPARARRHRIEKQARLRTLAPGRSQAAPAGHLAGAHPARLGAEDRAGGRTQAVLGLLPPGGRCGHQ